MFTGLIKDVGILREVNSNSSGVEIVIETSLAPHIAVDDSICVNGVCLTATQRSSESFRAQVVWVTLEKTNLKSLVAGSRVNLELSLTPLDRLGGHVVQGHVNTMGTVKEINLRGENTELIFSIPQTYAKYLLPEGSVAINGVSLTIAGIDAKTSNDQAIEIMISIIPHTMEKTHFKDLVKGSIVNVECDCQVVAMESLLKNMANSELFLSCFDLYFKEKVETTVENVLKKRLEN